MTHEIHEAVINGLRNVADKLELEQGDTLFPGWDYDDAIKHPENLERIQAVRRAAFAILNNDDMDSGIRVDYKDLGSLVRYIADLME